MDWNMLGRRCERTLEPPSQMKLSEKLRLLQKMHGGGFIPCARLSRERFKFEPAKGIPIAKRGVVGKSRRTKIRPIVLAPLENRIVQRSILDALTDHPAMQTTFPRLIALVAYVGKPMRSLPLFQRPSNPYSKPLNRALGFTRLRIAIVAVRSTNDDDVIADMYKQLKRGTRQFSGSRPGILCAHFLDLTPDQIMNLYRAQERREPSGFNLIATRLFKSPRPFLHSVHFSSPGALREKQEIRGNVLRHHVRERGLSYTFVNPSHPDAANESLAFF